MIQGIRLYAANKPSQLFNNPLEKLPTRKLETDG